MQSPNSGFQSTNSQLPQSLSIRLLGGFNLHYQGEAIHSVNTSRLQSLLAYLVLHKNALISRQHLAFLLWPDSSETQARTNLRNLVHKLRSALPDADQYLFTDKHNLQWQPASGFTLDVDEFSSLVGKSNPIHELKAAVQIYSGDLLPECYDDWIQPSRENLRQAYLNALERLTLLLIEDKQLREALHYAQILLRHDPIREETYRHLMELYARLGDRASVVQSYKTCITVLKQELDVEPGSATEEAFHQWVDFQPDWSSYQETRVMYSQDYIATSNLPTSLASLIGRRRELEQVKELLSKHRLVTLSGIGGVGKTRLALAAANELPTEYRDGIYMVDLALVSDPEKVFSAITDALYAGDEVQAAGLDGLTNFLSDQNLLLILDNCEHLTEEVGKITAVLLRACAELTILATSRTTLKVEQETIWQVPPLPVPEEIKTENIEDKVAQVQALQANECVELFIERAKSSLPTFAPTPEVLFSIGEICRRLEGIPLAIEMAAARIRIIAVGQIAQRLDDAIGLLQHPSNNILSRHQTMEAVMEWSYAMLTPSEGKLFTRLSVFAGDFSLQAAENICEGQGIQKGEILDLLAGLVDQSLVQNLQSIPETRFKLHEIARQYARQKMQTLENPTHWQNRHLDYFVRLAEEAEPELRGRRQVEWLDRLELEHENLRVTLQQTLDNKNVPDVQNIESAAILVNALWVFWFIRGRFSEGRSWAEKALASFEDGKYSGTFLGKLLYVAASFCTFQGDLLKAESLSQKSLDICRAHKDHFGEIVSYHHLGIISLHKGDFALASQHLHYGLELANLYGDSWLASVMNGDLGHLAKYQGDSQGAREFHQRALDIARQHDDTFQIIYALANIGEIAIEQGDIQQAMMFVEESLPLSHLLGEKRMIANNLYILGHIAMREKKHEQADELFKQSLQIMWGTRNRREVAKILVDLADNAFQQDKFEFAARLMAACEKTQTNSRGEFQLDNQGTFDRLGEEVRTQLDKGVFTAAWTLGGLMSLGQAVAFALANSND